MGTSLIAFIVVLGVLIFFHELGHFLIARLFGVGVEKFSLGFGPRLFGKKIGITDYRVSAIPLGGFVKLVGDEPDADLEPELIPISFTHKHVFKRICIVAAGPLFNLFLAFIIFCGLSLFYGKFILKPTVGDVKTASPAYESGIQKGDAIAAINKVPVETWEAMAALITQSGGDPLVITVRRNGDIFETSVTPELITSKNIFGEDVDRYVIGVNSGSDVISKSLNPLEAIVEGGAQTYEITKLTILSIVKLIQGRISSNTLGGPLMIAEMAGQQAKEGAGNLIFFIALLSINLAILNFMPIPVLDGGHLLFFLIEAIIGRPVNTRMREIAQQAGIFILILLMIFVFYNDITRIFFN
ncbi:MAG: RIP metalloprotease RseP [Desulfobacteraceae bacterium]|nr:RIP metalloprotease RseP [Desulfobacteraceae bacterium]